MVEKKTATVKTAKKVVKTVKPVKDDKIVKATKKTVIVKPVVIKSAASTSSASRRITVDKSAKKVTIKSEIKVAEPKKATSNKFIPAMGKRKTASASIRMTQGGTGVIKVNGQDIDKYFVTAYQRKVVDQPIKQTNFKDLDFNILVKGGGKTGQADACRLGIAKLLIKIDPELRSLMRAKGWVTRDSRKKERKKPGLKRARRAPQWSKR